MPTVPGGTIDEDVNDGERTGGRLALRWELTDNIAITPRLVYQDVDMNGFNRQDAYNILANPFTTTEPAVNIGEREQYRQFQERFDEEFFLGDLTMEFDLGSAMLTSVSSFTNRKLLVLRDASQLTGSVTFDIFSPNAISSQVRTNSALNDNTEVEIFTQELRLSSDNESRFQWVVGGFYSDIQRDYGQTLVTPGYDAILGAPSSLFGAPADTPFFSRVPYDFKQTAFFAEGSFDITERFNATLGARYYDFDEDRDLYFAGAFADSDGGPDEPTNGPGSTTDDGVNPRVLLSYDFSDNVQLNAQASEGFRLGGINDPLNVPLCQGDDQATYGGFDSFDSETLWNYELGAKIGFAGGRGQFNIAAFHADISDLQLPIVAGTCSSRVLVNVEEAHSTGVEMEISAAPTDHFDFGISASYTESELDSTLILPVNGVPTVIANIVEGNRLPSVPEFQLSANATFSWPMGEMVDGFITGVYQHVGSRYTQNGDQAPGFGTFPVRTFGDPTITELHVRPAAARVRHRQHPARRARRWLGGRVLREQRCRRERAARPRPGTRPRSRASATWSTSRGPTDSPSARTSAASPSRWPRRRRHHRHRRRRRRHHHLRRRRATRTRMASRTTRIAARTRRRASRWTKSAASAR